MSDRLSNFGSVHIKKQSSASVAVIPDVTMPLVSENITTDPHLAEAKLIVGHGFARHSNHYGQVSNVGDMVFLAEPNTAARLADMVLTKTATSGSGTYTHTFAKSTTTSPNYYTVQIQRGDIPCRYFGVRGRGLALSYNEGVGNFTVPVSAMGVFSTANISAVNSLVLTLDTTYNQTPTAGLVATDTIRIYKAGGTTVDTTVTSVDSATDITVASATGVAANDYVTLRALTPSLTLVDPILWARSEYRFSNTDAAAALSATHTPIEQGSGEWNILHPLVDEQGAMRSGSFYPASLPQTVADVELTTKMTFDAGSTERDFLLMKKKAIVCRHFSSTAYEVRLTINNAKATTKPNPLVIDDLIYDEPVWRPEYDASDATALGLVVINAISTI